MQTKALGRLHVLTDERLQSRWDHLELARLAIAGGANAVQFREKGAMTDRRRLSFAGAIAALCAESRHPCQLVVDDRADIAALTPKAGLHLGQDDLPPALARRLLGPDRIIGATVNDFAMLETLAEAPIDYVGIGPVFGTQSKANARPALGIEAFAALARAAPVPVIAIGSITAERVGELLDAGAYGVAVLGAVVRSEDPTAATAAFVQAFRARGIPL